jgi:pimeloyl-ACP methyl ester carboxylesterase
MSMNLAFGEVVLAAAAAFLLLLLAARYAARERLPMNDAARAKAPGRFVDLSVGRTHWLAEGPESGEVIVLVPGATLPQWIWRDLPSRLAAAGYRIIRYDLLGRGYSDRPCVPYNNDLFDKQLIELLAVLRIGQKAHLIGLAFGCPIISEFAVRHTNLVHSLCFIGPDGFGVHMSKAARLFMIPILGSYLFNLVGTRLLLKRIDDYSADGALKDWLRVRYAPELEFKGFKRALLSSIRNMPIHDATASYATSDSRLPVTVIWGDRDRVTPLPGLARLRGVLKRAKIHVLPDVGHLPHHERADETTGLILKHLSDVATAG